MFIYYIYYIYTLYTHTYIREHIFTHKHIYMIFANLVEV